MRTCPKCGRTEAETVFLPSTIRQRRLICRDCWLEYGRERRRLAIAKMAHEGKICVECQCDLSPENVSPKRRIMGFACRDCIARLRAEKRRIDWKDCKYCGVKLDEVNTPKSAHGSGGRCRKCFIAFKVAYFKSTPSEKRRSQHHKDSCALRWQTFQAYGGKCACCGETKPEFLAMDHIDGNGAAHRRKIKKVGLSFYRWLRTNNWPSGYRVLCHNCNCARGFVGYCPHEKGSWGDGYTLGSFPPDPGFEELSRRRAVAKLK